MQFSLFWFNSLFFSFYIYRYLLNYLGTPCCIGDENEYPAEREDKGAKRMRPKKREYELTYTEIVKSGTNRLTSVNLVTSVTYF